MILKLCGCLETNEKSFGFGMDSDGMKEGFAADVGDEGILGEVVNGF